MTGVSFMLPFVVAGGLSIALSFVFGINAAEQEGTLAAALMQIGGSSAFALMVPILAGYISFSIADRPGIAPGMIGGMLASSIGALSMLFGVGLRAPHGGVFVLPIPNVVTNLGLYAVAIVVGTLVTAAMLRILKPKLAE